MLPLRVMPSTMAPTVRMFTAPITSSRTSAGTAPRPASATGRARMPAPTVSVNVSANAIQNGGRCSTRSALRERNQASRSRVVSDGAQTEASGSPWSFR